MLGSKYTPRSAMSFSASSLTNAPCSTCVQPALAAAMHGVRRSARAPASAAPAPSPRRTPPCSCSIGHRLRAAVADALRREDLDEVGARRLLLADVRAHLRRASPVRSFIEPSDVRMRGPGSTPRAIASRSSLSLSGADALHGGEAVDQRHPAFSAANSAISAGRLALVLRPAVLAEVVADVDVGVDHARQQRDVAEVVGHRPRALIDPDDACRR